jgi:5'-nucleotidase
VRRAEYAQNKIVTNNLDGPDADTLPDSSTRPMPGIVGLIERYKELVAPIANQVVGHIDNASVVSRTTDASGESALGNLIADAQRADPSVVPEGGEQPEIAFMNPGGIRADLIENSDGDVTYEAAFTVQPFNNFDVSMDLTGAQIRTLLDQQFTGPNESFNKILQVSGITYTWDKSEPPASKVVDSSVEVNGVPLVDTQTYRVVVNSFLSDGGDGFTVLRDGTDKYVGGLDIDALTDYLTAHDPYTPQPTDRIDVQE